MLRSNFRILALVAVFLGLSVLTISPLEKAQALRTDEAKLPFSLPDDWRALPPTALVETTQGPFEIQFFRQRAPVSVKNFEHLVRQGYYNNTTFHRFIPGFILQGGDPDGTGKGGPGYTLPPEYSNMLHKRGTIGMARFPGQVNPLRRSHGSQFYICLSRAKHLDGLYTIFGEVVNGGEVLDKLSADDRVIRVLLPKKY